MNRTVAFVTTEPVGERMAGPAIRAIELARALSSDHRTEVFTTAAVTGHADVTALDSARLVRLADEFDVLVLGGDLLSRNPSLLEGHAALVADMYDPFHLELLEGGTGDSRERHRRVVADSVRSIGRQARAADFIICASERQRHLWLGHLGAAGRLNPIWHDRDPTLRSLVDVVPFGVQDAPPLRREAMVKGVMPGIGPGDRLLIWGGGIYEWLDPEILVRAVNRIRQQCPLVRLLFIGQEHPNPSVSAAPVVAKVRALSDELGLTGQHVFFGQGWVPYDHRGSLLLEADIGVTTHVNHIETEFSFRTRLLDYVWAGLPVVSTRGDVLSALVLDAGCGLTPPAGDEERLVADLLRILTDPKLEQSMRQSSARLAEEFRWRKVAAPLASFCETGVWAPDLNGSVRRRLSRRMRASDAGQRASGRFRRLAGRG